MTRNGDTKDDVISFQGEVKGIAIRSSLGQRSCASHEMRYLIIDLSDCILLLFQLCYKRTRLELAGEGWGVGWGVGRREPRRGRRGGLS